MGLSQSKYDQHDHHHHIVVDDDENNLDALSDDIENMSIDNDRNPSTVIITNFNDKESICSVNQYLRILMSNTLLNEHVKQMDIPPRMVGIDDIEWRSPYAKTRYKDIQMLESASNLPRADKYYTGSLKRVAFVLLSLMFYAIY